MRVKTLERLGITIEYANEAKGDDGFIFSFIYFSCCRVSIGKTACM